MRSANRRSGGTRLRRFASRGRRDAGTAHSAAVPRPAFRAALTPCRSARAASTSIFIFAMSTPVGHSRRHALQDTHSFIASASASDAMASAPSWPVSASRSVLARPRVRCVSSRVTRKDWAHHAGIERAAGAVVVAHLDRAEHAAERAGMVGPIELRREVRRPARSRARNGTACGRPCAADARCGPGFSMPVGIERVLHRFERADDACAKHRRVGIRCARCRRRARRCASLCIRAPGRRLPRRRRASFATSAGSFMFSTGPHMQAADRGVRVPGALGAVPLEHVVQPFGVVGEVFQIDRAVLDERHRFAVALHRHHDVQPGLAHRGDVGLERRIDGAHHRSG